MSTTTRLLFAVVLSCAAASLRGQCTTTWSALSPQATLSGTATCSTLWDPDGSGPAPHRLVVAGEALLGGAVTVGQRVVTWDGTRWQALGNGPGTSGRVTALTTWNGQLVAAGSFTGGGTDRIAWWNGSAWQPLGSGLPFAAVALAEWNGNLVAGRAAPMLQVWNGASWIVLPQPPSLTELRALVSYEGDLCVGGAAALSGGALARWNGTSWLPAITANGRINCLGVRSFQFLASLYVGGAFTNIGGTAASRIASTPGGTTFTWNTVTATGLAAEVRTMHVRATSALGVAVVAGTQGGIHPVFQLSGGSFVAMGFAELTSLSFYGGSYHGTDNGTSTVRRYNGSSWNAVLDEGLVGELRAITWSGPDVIVGGTFESTTGTALHRIARWNGSAFQPLGTGMQGGTSVETLLTLDNGDVLAGGLFPTAGGLTVNNIARWDGSAWSPLATGFDHRVLALCKMSNGDVVAGGTFATAGAVPCARIARWNGTSWSPLGSGMNGDVKALAVRRDGRLFAGGSFTTAGGVACSRIAQWNGFAWSPVGTGMDNEVFSLGVRPNDDVVAGGVFLTAGGASAPQCALWSGSAWASMGTPAPTVFFAQPRALLALPNGDVIVSSDLSDPLASNVNGISRWDGNAWAALGPAGGFAFVPAVTALVQRPDGVVFVGALLGIAPSGASPITAKIDSTCLPLAQPYGAGCSSSSGPVVLTADALPWLAAPFRTTTTGFAPFSLCLAATGFTQLSIPLPSLLAEGQPGCTLLASPDILTLLLPDLTGTVHTALALPNSPSLLGGVFYQQSLPLEFTAQMALVAVRGSNALALTIGTL